MVHNPGTNTAGSRWLDLKFWWSVLFCFDARELLPLSPLGNLPFKLNCNLKVNALSISKIHVLIIIHVAFSVLFPYSTKFRTLQVTCQLFECFHHVMEECS